MKLETKYMLLAVLIFIIGAIGFVHFHPAEAQDITPYDQNNQIIRQLEEQTDILKQILEVEKRIQERVETK